MNCYFCNANISDQIVGSSFCAFCTKQYNLHAVYTTYSQAGELLYAHIYIKLKNIGDYQIRLHINANTTWILSGVIDSHGTRNFNEEFFMPNFPFTPANAAEKLTTYLLLK